MSKESKERHRYDLALFLSLFIFHFHLEGSLFDVICVYSDDKGFVLVKPPGTKSAFSKNKISMKIIQAAILPQTLR